VSGFIGPCDAQPGQTMTVTADGVTRGVPQEVVPPDPDELIILDANEVDFRGTIPVPSRQTVEVVLVGQIGLVDLPPAFAVTPPAPLVSRRAPLVVAFEPLPGAGASADEAITCGSDSFEIHPVAATPGRLELDLPALDAFETGPCTHTVRLHQVIPLPTPAGLPGTTARTTSFTFTSTPLGVPAFEP